MVTALTGVRRRLGWNRREIETPVASPLQLLQTLKAEDGVPLSDLLLDQNGIRPQFTLLLNSRPLRTTEELISPLREDDSLVLMEALPFYPGG